MNDEQFDDLKQFISTTVGQTEARLSARIDDLEQKMDDGFAGVAEAIEQIHDTTDAHDHRISRLEEKLA